MTDHLKTIREALEILRNPYRFYHQEAFEALDALEAAMREPVAEVIQFDGEKIIDASMAFFDTYPIGTKLFAAPPAQQAHAEEVPDEIQRVLNRLDSSDPDFNDCSDAAALIRQMAEALKSCSGVPHWPSFAPLINGAAKWRAAQQAQAEAVPQEYTGVRCMCVLTGCIAGPSCPHYTIHCKAHIAHVAAAPQPKGGE